MDLEAVFHDVVPILADEGPNPMSPIAYPLEYSKAMDYFRACAKADERSQRVIDLTTHIIEMNPAHYTVWKVRQDCLFAVNADLKEELKYASEIGLEHHKNYQIWHHREVLISALEEEEQLIKDELEYINQQLDADSKNYHAWAYRQWLVKTFDYWACELPDTGKLISEDFRNNSAWNHRFFVHTIRSPTMSEEEFMEEVAYCKKYIFIAPHNESVWNYLKGFVRKFRPSDKVLIELESDVRDILKANFVTYAASFLLWLLEFKLANQAVDRDAIITESKKVCEELMANDVIRAKYWAYKSNKLL